MWAVMMAAMMLPSIAPMVLCFANLNWKRGEGGRTLTFVAAYLTLWAAFSGAATATQWALQSEGWVSPMIVSTSAALSGTFLIIAGVFQFTPLKTACLRTCRSPLGFLMSDWRDGFWGAWRMGLRHGLNCLGCCWALMALLFVGGVMNILWIAALTVLVGIRESRAERGRDRQGAGRGDDRRRRREIGFRIVMRTRRVARRLATLRVTFGVADPATQLSPAARSVRKTRSSGCVAQSAEEPDEALASTSR